MKTETIGNATLYLGDCRRLLPLLRAQAIVTDPPYLEGDQSDVLSMLLWSASRVVLTPGKLQAFNWIRRRAPLWEYCWQNATKSLGGSACLHIGWEPVLAYGMPIRPLGTDLLVYPIASEANDTGHPWPKPIKLMEKLVGHWSDAGDTVLDPFMGSGTTGIACANLGRKFVGIEMDPDYFDIACRRVENAQRQERLFA